MVLRIDPGIPMVWRTPTSVQFGVDVPRLVLGEVTQAYERMLAALDAGVSPSGWQMLARDAGLDPGEAERLLARLAPVMTSDPRPPAHRVLVTGEGALAGELAAQLADAGLLAGTGDPDPDLVVLVASWVITPEDHGAWLRRDIPHLPIVALDGSVTVGPFVEPGRGPCLYCVHLSRVDADPAWPAIATQLWGRPSPALTRTAVAATAAFAARRIRARLDAGPADTAVAWRLADGGLADDAGAITSQERRRHPRCSCAAPSESDWAPAADHEIPRATTTATAVRVPA
jgi:bacteriocin biosynthesis cyclodehydratase domain-containing protein